MPVEVAQAADVLDTLIDARLLTSYEVAAGDNQPPHHLIEIVHESLLSHWPRLVRWQMQDAEGAQLRDELRAQAQLWRQHDRSEDYLWTGTAFKEYELWRESYPGGLTPLEFDFGAAMSEFAIRRARQRKIAVVLVIALLAIGLAIVGAFWRRAEISALRAEAANLFSLARASVEDHPTAAIAYATASLERADNAEVRRLILDALWRGPTELRIPAGGQWTLDFSPDGRWLATAAGREPCRLWPSDGGPPTTLADSKLAHVLRIDPRGNLLAHNLDLERRGLGIWSLPEGRLIRTLDLDGDTALFQFSDDGGRLFTSTEILEDGRGRIEIRSWPLAGGSATPLASLTVAADSLAKFAAVNASGSILAWVDGRQAHSVPLEESIPRWESASTMEHQEVLSSANFDRQGRRLATLDAVGTVRIWGLDRNPPELLRVLAGTGTYPWLRFNDSGSMLVNSGNTLWLLSAPPNAEPLKLRRSPGSIGGELGVGYGVAFHPSGSWVATGHPQSVSLWPLARPYPSTLNVGAEITSLAFTPDGQWIVSTDGDGSVRAWPLNSGQGQTPRTLYQTDEPFRRPTMLSVAPDGSFAAIGTNGGQVVVLPFDGGPPRELSGFTDSIERVAIGPSSRRVAAGAGRWKKDEAVARVWNLETGDTQVLDHDCEFLINHLEFSTEGELLTGSCGYYRWNLDAATPRLVERSRQASFGLIRDISSDGQWGLATDAGRLWLDDLSTDTTRVLEAFGDTVRAAVFHPNGRAIMSADMAGAVRIGDLHDAEPHLLLGHSAPVGGFALAVAPGGEWIASGGEDGTIRLWPQPNVSQPPFHTLPRDELIAKLYSLTNLRALEDPESPSGWRLDIGPFPGWETVPTW